MADYLGFISETLKKASVVALEHHGKVKDVTKKEGDNSQILTAADIAIGKLILAEIEKHFPEHSVIDEEAGVIDKKSKFTWVVDPIDGTSNFAVGLPHYGIMIGLLADKKAIAGGVVLPSFNEYFLAEAGSGATKNGNQIFVNSELDITDALVAYNVDGENLTSEELKIFGEVVRPIRNLRSSNSVYDSMLVASGVYGGDLNQTSKVWDNVAMQIIVEEAGGVYTDFWGKPIDYSDALTNSEQNYTHCMGSPKIHRQLQEIVHSG